MAGAVAVQSVELEIGMELEGAAIELMLIGVIFKPEEGREMWSREVNDVRRGREEEEKKWAHFNTQAIYMLCMKATQLPAVAVIK